MNQLHTYIYIYPLLLRFFSYIGHYIVQRGTISGFADHVVSAVTTQLASITEAAVDNVGMNGHGYVPIKLHLQKQVGSQTWPKGQACRTLG